MFKNGAPTKRSARGTMNRSYSPEDRSAAAIGPVGDVGHRPRAHVPGRTSEQSHANDADNHKDPQREARCVELPIATELSDDDRDEHRKKPVDGDATDPSHHGRQRAFTVFRQAQFFARPP